ncbi:MAG: hypothetical protein ACFNZP_00430 [Bifidobacterium dentium]
MLDLTIGRWELAARYDVRQSFCRKAFYRVEEYAPSLVQVTLSSYGIDVAAAVVDVSKGRVAYSVAGAEPLVWLCADEDDYSATTVRHVREFLKQLGLEAGSKAEIFKTYGLRDGKDGE